MSEHNELSYNERLEEIARLETELKGLRDLENLRVLAIKSLQVENKALRVSRDELLKSCQVIVERIDPMRFPMNFVDELRNQIQRAKVLKDKKS